MCAFRSEFLSCVQINGRNFSCFSCIVSISLVSFKTGKFSHDIDSGHLFVPRRVHSNGTHLSYNVTHFHEFNHPNEISGSDQLDKLHYHIDLHDETLHLELE